MITINTQEEFDKLCNSEGDFIVEDDVTFKCDIKGKKVQAFNAKTMDIIADSIDFLCAKTGNIEARNVSTRNLECSSIIAPKLKTWKITTSSITAGEISSSDILAITVIAKKIEAENIECEYLYSDSIMLNKAIIGKMK